MTEKKSPGDNLHYLENFNPSLKREEQDFQHLLVEMSQRIKDLEKELHGDLKHLQKELKGRKTVGPQKAETLAKEIKDLKDHFEKQLESLSEALPQKRSKFQWSIPSPSKLLKKVIPNLHFWNQDRSSDEFQKMLQEDIDPFGRDPAFEEKIKPFIEFLYHKYWRTSTEGIENIPSTGRALFVANHSGTLPYDGSMLRYAVSFNHPAQRELRFLVEDFVYYLPFIGTYMYRVGGVRASRDNAQRLLESDHLVAVFPEGVKGIGKKYTKRYHLQRFGRGGFIKLALTTKSPIIPVAIIGAEEIHPILYKSSFLAKPLGIPYIPITPTWPLLGPLGLIPLPSKWFICFGEPIELHKKYGQKTLEDELQIHKLSEMVRKKIQEMITDALKKRRSVWFG